MNYYYVVLIYLFCFVFNCFWSSLLGQTISLIRSTAGVHLKGSDVDDEHRLVLISGMFDNVVRAFDLISELLAQSNQHRSSDNGESSNFGGAGNFCVHVLLEHSKAGKAVGARGTMMQTIKAKSSVHNVRIEKEPKVNKQFS